jgi:hypothetical protein
MTTIDAKRFPTLARLVEAGLVRLQGREYVGQASDGVEVNIGAVGFERYAENYLSARPSPEQW